MGKRRFRSCFLFAQGFSFAAGLHSMMMQTSEMQDSKQYGKTDDVKSDNAGPRYLSSMKAESYTSIRGFSGGDHLIRL